MTSSLVRLSLPERILAEIGRTTSIRVRVTELGGVERKIMVRALGNLGGPLPATEVDLPAGGSIRTEVSVSIPSGMPPGEHQYLFEVLDRDNGRVLESIDATVDIQHTRSVSMSVQPQSIRKRMRGRVRVVIRNHDDEPHKIRLRAEGDDGDTRVSLERPGIIIRPGEMVRVPARVKVKPYYIGKQKERFYSVIGEGAGVPVYARGNVRQKPMIGKNVKSLGLLGSIIIVWLTLTIAVIRLVSPATQEAAVGAETGTEQPGGGSETPVSPLVPVLVDVNGTVTAVPDGSGVVVSWRPVSLGDAEATAGKVAGGSAVASPDIALQTTNTDADGKFVVAGLDGAGLYEFSFAKAGHQTQTKIVQPNGQPVTLEVALVAGSGTIGGIAVDEAGRALGGVDITLSDGAITYGSSTPTDGDSAGRFQFNNLSSPGTYVLDARIAGRGLASTTIELQTGQAVTDIRLVLRADVATLAGRIGSAAFEGATGTAGVVTPQANIAARLPTFTVTATDGTLTRSTTTLSEGLLAGTFRLEQLPINRTYTVTYESPGFLSFTEQIELKLDTPERQIAMTRSTGRLRGKVTVQGSNLSPTSVAVTVTNPDFTYKATDAISSDGSMLIDGIEPGRYVVVFEALGLVSQTREAVIGAGTSTTLDVTMSAVQSTSKASSLSFKVTKEGDATDTTPVTATLMYRLTTDCGTAGQANNCSYTVGADGNLVVDGLEAGGYVIRFRATGYADKFVSAQVAFKTAAPQVPVSLTPLGTLQGAVTDDTSAPLQGIQVGLFLAGQSVASTLTNTNGEFSFVKKLEAKNYTVKVTSNAYEGSERSVTGALSATLNLDMTVRGLAVITGEVQEFDLVSGQSTPVPPARFATFLRQGTNDATDPWTDAVSLGLAKSLGGFRLGVANNVDSTNTQTAPPYDICLVIVSEPDTLDSLASFITGTNLTGHPCNSNDPVTKNRFRRSLSSDLNLEKTEIATRSAFFSPDPGAIRGLVTVNGTPQANVRVEARRVDQSDRIIESVSTKTNTQGQFVLGSFVFGRLTPVRPASAFEPSGAGDTLVLTDYGDHDACDREKGACWLIRASAENTGYTDSDYLAVYPNSNFAIPTLDIVQSQASSLSVTIRDTLGTAVTTATVKVNGTTKCNANTPAGKCIVNDPTVGSEAQIEVSAAGFRTANSTVGIGVGTTAVTISLVPVSGVEITVLDPIGNAIAGASAGLVDSSGADLSCAAVTDAQGKCTVAGASRGPAIISASKNNVGAVTTFGSVLADPSTITAQLTSATANVTGVVENSANSSPVGGATVRLVETGGNRVFSTTTASATGRFFLGNVPAGSWTLETSAPGFSSRTGVALTVTSGLVTVPVADTQLANDQIVLVGKVSSGGSGVPGAAVTLTAGSEIRTAITNAVGDYRFAGLTGSVWTLTASGVGFVTFTEVLDGDAATQGDQPLPIGVTTRNVSLSPMDGVLEISTRTSGGSPLNNIRVRVYASEQAFNATPNAPLAGPTNSLAGLASISNLPPGQYWIRVDDPAGIYAAQSFVANIDRGFTTRLPVYLGSTRAVVVIGLAGIPAVGFGPQKSLDVKVRLVDASTNPATVIGPVRTTLSFDRGVATLVDVPSASYQVQIDHDQPSNLNVFTSRADIVESGTTYLVPNKTISVQSAGTRDEGLLLLHAKPVSVAIRAATDCANFATTKLSSFTASIRDGYLLTPTTPTSGVNGEASIASIPPGSHLVEVVSSGYATRVESLTVLDSSVSPATTHCVQMTPTAQATLVPLLVTVTGPDPDGAGPNPAPALSQATATISPDGLSCRTDNDGKCTIFARPDSYSVRVTHDQHSTVVGGPVTVTAAAGGALTVGMSALSVPINFYVKQPDGSALLGFTVDSLADSFDCSDTVSGVNNGECTVSGLTDLELRIFKISATGHHPVYVSARATVGSTSTVIAVLQPTAVSTDTLQVSAFDPTTGLAISQFTVKNNLTNSVICTEDSSDADDHCSAGAAVADGSLQLKVEATGFENGFATVTITPSTSTVVKVALYRKPSLLIRTRAVDGNQPLAGVTVKKGGVAVSSCGFGAVAVTNADGLCNLDSLTTGNLTFEFSKADYFTSTAVITISGGTTSIDVLMRPKGSLEVTLNPHPASNTAVTISGTGLTCTVSPAPAPASCTISDIPVGTWIVTASGHKPATVYVTQGSGSTVTLTT